jgi:hypothetical protein
VEDNAADLSFFAIVADLPPPFDASSLTGPFAPPSSCGLIDSTLDSDSCDSVKSISSLPSCDSVKSIGSLPAAQIIMCEVKCLRNLKKETLNIDIKCPLGQMLHLCHHPLPLGLPSLGAGHVLNYLSIHYYLSSQFATLTAVPAHITHHLRAVRKASIHTVRSTHPIFAQGMKVEGSLICGRHGKSQDNNAGFECG